MVLPFLLNEKYKNKKKKILNKIENIGIETRPIISGSFVNQPATKLYKLNKSNNKFLGAEKVEKLGFVIGLNSKKNNEKNNK